MAKKFVHWLYDELPELTEKGIISAESAQKLREHYGEVKVRSGRQLAIVLFSILGATLIGLGIILMFAHNWDKLTRPMKTVISIAPLLIGQILSGATILRRKDSVAWREGTSTFLMISIGAAIALISQTYHIAGDMGSFLMTWMLLSIPLVYLMNVTVPAIFYVGLLTLWTGYASFSGEHPILYFAFAALIVPHLWIAMKENRYGSRAVAMLWVLSISLCFSTAFSLGRSADMLWIINYSGIFAIMYIAASYWFKEAPKGWQRPLEVVGGIGILVMTFILTYQFPWEGVARGYSYARHHIVMTATESWLDVTATVLLIILPVISILAFRLYKTYRMIYMVLPLPAAAAYMIANAAYDVSYPVILFNMYMALLGVVTLVAGIRKENLGIVNAGMLILIVMIVARFFDLELSFLVRGFAFVLCGIAFLMTNVILLRRRKGGAQ